ncbi:MAG: hypothetical protein P8O79_03795 [Halieaceae bacterium]|nr:hypothetical protein [Halieaceae bacterium]
MSLIRAIVLVSLLSASGDVLSKCLMVGQLKGWTAKERDSHVFEEDGFSSSVFYLNFADEGKDSWMSDSPSVIKIPCANLGVLTCVDQRYGDTILNWAIDSHGTKVTHTRIYDGTGVFDGVSAMVGEVLGECKL